MGRYNPYRMSSLNQASNQLLLHVLYNVCCSVVVFILISSKISWKGASLISCPSHLLTKCWVLALYAWAG